MTELERYEQLYNSLVSNGELFYAGLLLQRAAQLWPDRIAIICQGTRITWRELFERTQRISVALAHAGIKPGDRVMLLYENAINFYAAYFGIWQMGAIVVPVNTMLHANELAHIIKSAQPQGLILSQSLLEKVAELVTGVPVVISQQELDRIQLEPLKNKPVLVARKPDELSVLLYTSGTTGLPKGVMLSSRNIMSNMLQATARLTLMENDSVLGAMPLFHSFTQNTCLWMPAFLGITVILVPRVERRALLEGLASKPTFIVGIPQLYGLFCMMKTAPFERVRYFVSGGDALPDKIRKHFELIYRRKLCNGYGLTETSPFISGDLDDVVKIADTVGRPFVHIECQIRDETGAVLPQGNIGRLWVKGPNIMLGYYNAPELTAKDIVDGWFNTGDLALISPEGKIVLAGREKDLIKVKGIKVYPGEIEQVIMGHPLVMGVAVVGQVWDDEEVPVAFVLVKEPSSTLEKELKDLCARNLANYEIPRVFIIRGTLPMTATGKIDKKVLKKELVKHS